MHAGHWADVTAERIIRQRGERDCYVVASGVAPSGSVHFGHLREVMSTELVARALRDRGKRVRFIYSWDDYDVFRKVPADLPRQEELARHLRKPVVAVPDPFEVAPNFAAGFEQGLEQVLPRLGIEPEYLYQAQRYRAARYADGIRTALARRAVIRGILDRHRDTPLPEDYWPITIYSELDGTDNTTVLNWDGADTVTYRDVDGTEKRLDLTRSGAAKLLWRIDWPMRWAYEGVDCEPAGKDHHSAGGSFDTGGPIAREVYDYEPPVTFLFGDVGVKGGAGRIPPRRETRSPSSRCLPSISPRWCGSATPGPVPTPSSWCRSISTCSRSTKTTTAPNGCTSARSRSGPSGATANGASTSCRRSRRGRRGWRPRCRSATCAT